MNVLARRLLRQSVALSVAVVAGAGTAVVANASPSAAVPDPCALLAKVHPEHTIAKGSTVTVKPGKLVKYGSGKFASFYCAEMVGKLTVAITVAQTAGGFGGVRISSTTHPSGLGSGDTLVVGTGPSGGPVDFINFHTTKAYVSVSANGATPSNLTALARQVYMLVR